MEISVIHGKYRLIKKTPSLDLVTKVSESMEIPHRVNYVKEKISSAVPPTITKRFEEFKGSKEFSTVYEFCADFTTAANGMVSSSLTRFQNSRDTVSVYYDLGLDIQSLPGSYGKIQGCATRLRISFKQIQCYSCK